MYQPSLRWRPGDTPQEMLANADTHSKEITRRSDTANTQVAVWDRWELLKCRPSRSLRWGPPAGYVGKCRHAL